MSIRQISLNNFRNIKSNTLDLHKSLNIITGLNASGKTSFLEAIHILCQGGSFKTHQLNSCIKHNEDNFLLFGRFENYKAGISRTNLKSIIRIDNETIHKVSSLAKRTPVKIINSSCFDLITGSPSKRREYSDWCLFHVEHNYLQLYSEYNHALKQRNALLKLRKNLDELDHWDNFISTRCEEITDYRKSIIKEINLILENSFPESFTATPMYIKYISGWDTQVPFLEVLKENRSRDIKYGFTRFGSHRDDLKFISNDYNIQNVFSRGQIKKISIFLIIAQLILLGRKVDKNLILLIDDISSELDDVSLDYILEKISQIDLQIFITNINLKENLYRHHKEYKLFHVEHGMIKTEKNIREHNVRI